MQLINHKLIKQICTKYSKFAPEPIWWIQNQSMRFGYGIIIWERMPDFGRNIKGYLTEECLTCN